VTTSQSAISIAQLRAEFAGQVIGPEDAHYDDARADFLPLHDSRPAVIVRPVDKREVAGPVDKREVAGVISLARESGLEPAVRSGGHSYGGHGDSEGAIVLDLSLMKALEIDPDRRLAQMRATPSPHMDQSARRDQPASELADWPVGRCGPQSNWTKPRGPGHGGLRRRPDPRYRNQPDPTTKPVLSLARSLISHPTQGRQRS
jgi:FAD binding domain